MSAEAAAAAAIEIRPADPAVVEAALRQGGVAGQRPGLGPLDYLFDLATALGRAIDALIGALIDAFGGAVSADFLVGTLGFLFALVLLLLLFVLLRLWLSRPKNKTPVAELLPASAAPALAPGEDWEAEIERRLARGEIHRALEAIWWWLAGRLAAKEAEPSWTTRELVLRAGRRDLLRPVMPLDRLLYAGLESEEGDVRRVFGNLREAVAPAPDGGAEPAARGER